MDILDKNKLLNPLFALIVLTSGCASIDSGQTDSDINAISPESQSSSVDTPPTLEEPIEYGNFSEEILNRVIIAELSGQRGLNQEALSAYLSLARDTLDLGIIKRAARIAAFSRNNSAAIEMANLWLEIEPNSVEAHQNLAFQFVSMERYGQALDQLTQLLELGSEVDFRIITASLASSNNIALVIDALINDFEEIKILYPANRTLNLALAGLYQENKQLQEAYEIINQLSQQEDTPEIIILELQLLEQMGEEEKAGRRLQQSLRTNPEHKQLRFLYGRKLVDERRYNDAMEQFSIIVEQNPDDFDMLYSLALISMEVNQFSNAKTYLQRLVDNGQRLDDSHYYLAYLYTQENDADEAIKHYLLVKDGANFLPAQRNVTDLMIQQGHYAEASARLQTIRFKNSDFNIPLLTMEANVLLENDMQEDARKFLNNAVGAFPENMPLLFLRSVLSADLNDLPLMEQDLRKIIRLNPNNPTAYNSLGYTLADRTDRLDEAYELIKKAYELAPEDPAIIDSLGWIQYRLGLYEEARASLDTAFELYPDHEVAAHFGEVLWILGEKRKATRIWEDALKVEPNSKFILETMNRLNASTSR